jgi:hypothetical protein
MGDHIQHTAKGQKGRKIVYERKNMVLNGFWFQRKIMYERKNIVLNEFWFQELIMVSSFLANIDGVATIGDAQGTLKRTHFPLPLPSVEFFIRIDSFRARLMRDKLAYRATY